MERALLLDKNYMALSLVPWKKAVKLMVNGKAEPVQGSGVVYQVSGTGSSFKVPSIIRLVSIIPWRAHMGRMKFSRKNILIRDNFECQYCGTKISRSASTIDHVVPRCKGGETSYKNCVACCKACNNKKGSKTLDEIKMQLKRTPKNPTFFTLYNHYLSNSPKEWRDYIIGF